MHDRPYARRRRSPRTNYALTSTRWDFFVVGFSKHNANCACANRGYSRQIDLDIVYVVNKELSKRNLRCFIVSSSQIRIFMWPIKNDYISLFI